MKQDSSSEDERDAGEVLSGGGASHGFGGPTFLAAPRMPRWHGRRVQSIETKTRDELKAFAGIVAMDALHHDSTEDSSGLTIGELGMSLPLPQVQVLRSTRLVIEPQNASETPDQILFDPESEDAAAMRSSGCVAILEVGAAATDRDSSGSQSPEYSLRMDSAAIPSCLRGVEGSLNGAVLPGSAWSKYARRLALAMADQQLACMKFMCPICLNTEPLSQGFSVLRCSQHITCQTCAKNFVLSAVNAAGNSPDSLLNLVCPGHGCTVKFAPLDVMRLYGPESMVGVRRRRARDRGMQSTNTCCSVPSLFHVPEAGHPELQRYLRFFRRQGGEYRECPRCGFYYHNAMEQLQKGLRDARRAAERALVQVLSDYRGDGGGAAAASAMSDPVTATASESQSSAAPDPDYQRELRAQKVQLDRLALAAEVALAEHSDVQCARCWQQYCIQHDTQHVGISCRSYITRKHLQDSEHAVAKQYETVAKETGAAAEAERLKQDAQDQLDSLYLIQRSTVPCPSCGYGVHKTEACNHMTCPCGQHFCYLCGYKMPKPDPYKHFHQPGPCKGKLYGGSSNINRDETVQRGAIQRMSADERSLKDQAGSAGKELAMRRMWTERRSKRTGLDKTNVGGQKDAIAGGMEARRRVAYSVAQTYRCLDRTRASIIASDVAFYATSIILTALVLPFILAAVSWMAVAWVLVFAGSLIFALMSCQPREALALVFETTDLVNLLWRTDGLLRDGGMQQLYTEQFGNDESTEADTGTSGAGRDQPHDHPAQTSAHHRANPQQGAAADSGYQGFLGHATAVELPVDGEVARVYADVTKQAEALAAEQVELSMDTPRAGETEKVLGVESCKRPTGLIWIVLWVSLPALLALSVPTCCLLGGFQVLFRGCLPWWREAKPNVLACLLWEVLPGYRSGSLLSVTKTILFVMLSVVVGIPVGVLRAACFASTSVTWMVLALICSACMLDSELATCAASFRFLSRSRHMSTAPLMPAAGNPSFQVLPWEAAELLLAAVLVPVWICNALLEEIHVVVTGTARPFSVQRGVVGVAAYRCFAAVSRLFSCRRWRRHGRGTESVIPAALKTNEAYYSGMHSQVVPERAGAFASVAAAAPTEHDLSATLVGGGASSRSLPFEETCCCKGMDVMLWYIWQVFASVFLRLPCMVLIAGACTVLAAVYALLFGGMWVLVLAYVVPRENAIVVLENDVRNPGGPFAGPAVWGSASLMQYAMVLSSPVTAPLMLVAVGFAAMLQELDDEAVLPFDPTGATRQTNEPNVLLQVWNSWWPVLRRPEDVIYGREHAVRKTAELLGLAKDMEEQEDDTGCYAERTDVGNATNSGKGSGQVAAAALASTDDSTLPHLGTATPPVDISETLKASILGSADKVAVARSRLEQLQRLIDGAEGELAAKQLALSSLQANQDASLAHWINDEFQRGNEVTEAQMAAKRQEFSRDHAELAADAELAKRTRDALAQEVAQAVPEAHGIRRADLWLPHAGAAAVYPVLIVLGWCAAAATFAAIGAVSLACNSYMLLGSIVLLPFTFLALRLGGGITGASIPEELLVSLLAGSTLAHRLGYAVHAATGVLCIWPVLALGMALDAWTEGSLPRLAGSTSRYVPPQQGAGEGGQSTHDDEELSVPVPLLALAQVPRALHSMCTWIWPPGFRSKLAMEDTKAADKRGDVRPFDRAAQCAKMLVEGRPAILVVGVPPSTEVCQPTPDKTMLHIGHAVVYAAAALVVILPVALT